MRLFSVGTDGAHGRRVSIDADVHGAMIRVVAAAAVYFSLTSSTLAAAETDDPSYALVPGEYELVVEGASRLKTKPVRKGSLSLRKWRGGDQVSTALYPLYGWTDINLRNLGMPLDASSVPSASKDPENPGVRVFVAPPRYDGLFKSFKVHQASGAPVLLIGTLENRKATRGGHDGGGIGLFVQGREGQCLHGHWASVGPFAGGIGQFKVCPRGLPQRDGSAGQNGPSR
jgi:hypothetical protein